MDNDAGLKLYFYLISTLDSGEYCTVEYLREFGRDNDGSDAQLIELTENMERATIIELEDGPSGTLRGARPRQPKPEWPGVSR